MCASRRITRTALCCCLTCLLLCGTALSSWAISYRVLVSTEERQLRSGRLVARGQSALPASANATAQTTSATEAAVRRAIARVREDLEAKLRSRGLTFLLRFPGQPPAAFANATVSPGQVENDPAVLGAAAYIHKVTDIGTMGQQGKTVEVDVEVVYIMQHNATPAAPTLGTPPSLQLTAPEGGEAVIPRPAQPVPAAPTPSSQPPLDLAPPQGGEEKEVDRDEAEKRILHELLERLKGMDNETAGP